MQIKLLHIPAGRVCKNGRSLIVLLEIEESENDNDAVDIIADLLVH